MGVVTISTAAFAQSFVLQTSLEQPANQSAINATTAQGGVMKKDGKMWCIEPISDSIILGNMVVYCNGNYRTKKGQNFTLKNGGRIDFLGAVESMDQRINEDSGMVVMDNGSVSVWNLLLKPLELTNGNYIFPDGRLRVGDEQYVALDDRTFIDYDGNLTAMPGK
jgi:hypothetical protein